MAWARVLGWVALALVAVCLPARDARACSCSYPHMLYPAFGESNVPTNAVVRLLPVMGDVVARLTLEAEDAPGTWTPLATTPRNGPAGVVDLVPLAPLPPATAHRVSMEGAGYALLQFSTGAGPRTYTDAPVTLTGAEADLLPEGGTYGCRWYDGFVVQHVEGLQRGHPHQVLLRRLWFQSDGGPSDPYAVGEDEMDEDAGTLRTRSDGCQTGVLLSSRHSSNCVQLLLWTPDGGTTELGERRCTQALPLVDAGSGPADRSGDAALPGCACAWPGTRAAWMWLALALVPLLRSRRAR